MEIDARFFAAGYLSPRVLFNFQGHPDLVWVKFDHFSIKA
jgi:hypothetical protein